MNRWIVVFALVAAVFAPLSIPVATVHACSCMDMTREMAIENAELAFVGIATDSINVAGAPGTNAPLVRYAFEVERASESTPELVEVSLIEGDGANCGMSIPLGDRWFVAAYAEEGTLHSNGCAGNLPLDGLATADVEELDALLPFVASGAPSESSLPTAEPALTGAEVDSGSPLLLAALVAVAAAVALGFVMLLALRRRPTS